MSIAIWIIAIVEVIRMIQNFIQIRQIKKANENPHIKRATDEFVESLKRSDKEFVEDLLRKVEEQERSDKGFVEDLLRKVEEGG